MNSWVKRRIDELGRVVIPKELRQHLKIKEGDILDIELVGDSVVLKRHYDNSVDEIYRNIATIEDTYLRTELYKAIDEVLKECESNDR